MQSTHSAKPNASLVAPAFNPAGRTGSPDAPLSPPSGEL
jgi:hypothetical protein